MLVEILHLGFGGRSGLVEAGDKRAAVGHPLQRQIARKRQVLHAEIRARSGRN